MSSTRTTRSVRLALRGAVLFPFAFSLACASGSSARKGADRPAWVDSASYIEGRSMFGIGASAGIKNTGLSRKRAANRARNEIAAVVNTYSAALMKDYSASISTGDLNNPSEEQLVESAVKTFTSALLVGVQIRSYYKDERENVVYALAELNLDRQAQIAASKTSLGSGFNDWVRSNGGRVLGNLENDMKGRPSTPPPAPPPAEFQEEGTASAPPPSRAAPSASAPVAAAPAASATQRTCDNRTFLCAEGQGPDQASADLAARAELARVFEAKIRTTAESYASAARTISSKTGEDWIETQQFTERSLVTSNKDVRMSRILGRWKTGDTFHALVGIDRAQAARDLSARIQEQDRVVQDQVAKSQDSTDAIQRLKHARTAIGAFVAREALNSDLRVVRADGGGVPSPVSMADLLALLQEANRQLKLGIALAGPGAEQMQACLEEALTAKNYEVQSKVDEQASNVDLSGDFDVLIKGRLRAQNLGKVGRAEVVKVQLTLRLINNKTQKIVKTISKSKKGSRSNREAALSTAAVQLCKQQIPEMIRDIDRYFVR